MITPEIINRLYQDIDRIPATTVVLPRLADVRHRYNERSNIILNEGEGYKISHPDSWIIDNDDKEAAIQMLGGVDLLSARILFGIKRKDSCLPVIFVTAANLREGKFANLLQHQLNALKNAGIKTSYYSDDHLRLVTVNLKQSNRDGSCLFHILKYFVRQDQVFGMFVLGLGTEQLNKEAGLFEDIMRIVQSFTFIEKPQTG